MVDSLNGLWCGRADSPSALSAERQGRAVVLPTMSVFRSLSPLAICAVAALIGGTFAGGAAVYGLHPKSYGPTEAPALISATGEAAATEGALSDCEQCSERDLGYRWAVLQDVRSSTECPNDSWGFRRGCLDYTGGV